MNTRISIIPCYSQDGSVVTFIIDNLDGGEFTGEELAEALRDYADLLSVQELKQDGLN